jgi:hypothetical protein
LKLYRRVFQISGCVFASLVEAATVIFKFFRKQPILCVDIKISPHENTGHGGQACERRSFPMSRGQREFLSS